MPYSTIVVIKTKNEKEIKEKLINEIPPPDTLEENCRVLQEYTEKQYTHYIALITEEIKNKYGEGVNPQYIEIASQPSLGEYIFQLTSPVEITKKKLSGPFSIVGFESFAASDSE